MALNRTDGVFSPTMFHPTVFDTGGGKSTVQEPEENLRQQLSKEDDDILAIIIAIGSDI